MQLYSALDAHVSRSVPANFGGCLEPHTPLVANFSRARSVLGKSVAKPDAGSMLAVPESQLPSGPPQALSISAPEALKNLLMAPNRDQRHKRVGNSASFSFRPHLTWKLAAQTDT
eukprot:1414775-Amphidinium_carterae.1